MENYVKSEQKENVYCKVIECPEGCFMVEVDKECSEPTDSKVVGTFSVHESGYDYETGDIYDKVIINFNKKK